MTVLHKPLGLILGLGLWAAPLAAADRLLSQRVADVNVADDGRILVSLRKQYLIPEITGYNSFTLSYELQLPAALAADFAAPAGPAAFDIPGRGIRIVEVPARNTLLQGSAQVVLEDGTAVVNVIDLGDRRAAVFPAERRAASILPVREYDLHLPRDFQRPEHSYATAFFKAGTTTYLIVAGSWWPEKDFLLGAPLRPHLQVMRWQDENLDTDYGGQGVAAALDSDFGYTNSFRDGGQYLAHHHNPADDSLTILLSQLKVAGAPTSGIAFVRFDRTGDLVEEAVLPVDVTNVVSFAFTSANEGVFFAKGSTVAEHFTVDLYRARFDWAKRQYTTSKIPGGRFNLGDELHFAETAGMRVVRRADFLQVFSWPLMRAHSERHNPITFYQSTLDAHTLQLVRQATIRLPSQKSACYSAFRRGLREYFGNSRDGSAE